MARKKTDLVIVESPAKARTIEKYLGTNYRVVASMGHLRDLPKSKLGVDVEGDFEPDYIPVKGREELIKDLKDRADKANTVYLATDPDREGEAISWHLKELLELPDDKARRVTFNEITKKVVSESIENPRDIDMSLVDSQQARRVLDRIVGYKLSPLLWKKVRRGLSAGRVQSVATRMVVEREREIRNFVSEEYWHLDAKFVRPGKSGEFTARYYGDTEGKKELHSEAETSAVREAVEDKPFIIDTVKRGEKKRSPSPPFITSTLQQEASRRLGMTPRRTMSIAQQLYEGVDVEGQGTIGLITYMRTDSLRLSEDALSAARTYIEGHYGKDYYYGKPRVFKARAGAQDAHEAIRPTYAELSPEVLKRDLTSEQYRLYRLIWGRFIASQMANAIYDSVTIDLSCSGHVFRANHSEQKFAGYTAVYEESRDEEKSEHRKPLPNLEEGETANAKELTSEQLFTQPPARYTEATLIRAMEEKGIGRPSTYAPTISTITSREYVVKESKHLRPTSLGEVVTELMELRFSDIVDLKFTANMEAELDKIEEGKLPWKSLMAQFYAGFDAELKAAEKALEGEYIKVPDEVSEEVCPVCGKNLIIKSGRFGRFLACPGYPECSFTMPMVLEMPGKCPKCNGRMLKRTSRNGYTFYACEYSSKKMQEMPGGHECDFVSWDVPTKDNCPECSKSMFKRSGKGANKPFCINEACTNFLPEDKRGYKKKVVKSEGETGAEDKEQAAAEKVSGGKAKKAPAAKKTAAAKKSSTAKKAPAKKTTSTSTRKKVEK